MFAPRLISSMANSGIISRWKPRSLKPSIDFVEQHWRKLLAHFIGWSVLVVFSISSILVGYITFYNWYIPAERISRPVYLQYDPLQAAAALRLETVHPGISYDVSLTLLIPDIAGLSESLGNVMISTTLEAGSTLEHSSRPTLLVYRSWPTRLALLALRLAPVVLGIAREATTHRVFLFEAVPIHTATAVITVKMDKKIPVYEAILEMVAHFKGLRYLMYYWRWVFGGLVVGLASALAMLSITIGIGISLYLRLSRRNRSQDHDDDEPDSDSVIDLPLETPKHRSHTKSVASSRSLYSINGLRRRNLADMEVPRMDLGDTSSSGMESDTEDD